MQRSGQITPHLIIIVLVEQNVFFVQFTELPRHSSLCANAHLLTIPFNNPVIDKPLR
jgi:hypothetical protein